MPKFSRIFLNVLLSLLIIFQNLIFYVQPVQAAAPECKAVGVLLQPSKVFNKDNDEISFTVSLAADGSTLKTTIPTDKFSINTRFNKTLFLGIGFPDQITGTSFTFSFDRDNNITVATTKLQLSTVFGSTWPIGQYEVRLIKNGSDYCVANPALYIAPTQLVEAANCSYSLPANIHYGDGYQITDFQFTNVSGVIYTPLLFEGNKKDSEFTLATERDAAQSLGIVLRDVGPAAAAGAGLGATVGLPFFGVGAVPGAIVGGVIGLGGAIMFNFMNPDGFGVAKTLAENYIIFDKTSKKLEIKNNIPTRADGYTLVMSAKLENNWWLSHGLIGNQFGTACWVNRFKVTTDPTSQLLRQGTYGDTENPTHAQTTKPKTAPILAKAGGNTCGDEVESGISTAIGCIHTKPVEFVKDFMKFAIGISGGLAFLMMLSGAFQMITSAGSPEALKSGQDRLTSAVIGLLFIIFATLLLQIIGVDILKIPGLIK